MKVYFPLVIFPVSEPEGQKVCDYVLQGFALESDARELYPDAEIKLIEFDEPNSLLN